MQTEKFKKNKFKKTKFKIYKNDKNIENLELLLQCRIKKNIYIA